MFDTVNFRLTRAEAEGVDFLNEVTPYLDPDGRGFHEYSGLPYVTGKIGNLRVTISNYQIRVKDGSLCKWMLGDNYQSITRRDVKHAVERMSDVLHLPMKRAIITRLDIGLSIPVRYPTACYFNHLGFLKYAQRIQQSNSLYYYRHSKAECLCFYDKNREQRAHGEIIPDLYHGVNVLRYEQRFMSRLPQLLGVSQVTAAMLYDEPFYISRLNGWREAYQAISKENESTLNFRVMRTKTGMRKMGILALAKVVGGSIELIAQFKEAQKRGELKSWEVSNLKREVEAICNGTNELTVPSEAISELDKKIAEAIKYYR